MTTQLITGNLYTFTTIKPDILGGVFTKVRMTGELEYGTAKLLEPNIDSLQAALKPYLPPGASTKHTAYTYCVFETADGSKKVFAVEWVNLESITEETIKFLDIRINGADSTNLSAIKSILGLAGFPVVNEIT